MPTIGVSPGNQPDAYVPVVDVGPVLPDDNFAQFTPQASPGIIWTDYVVNNRYESDRHTYMMGITSPNGFQPSVTVSTGGQQAPGRKQTAAFVQLAAPTLLLISDWTASRINAKPITPSPASSDPNWVLLDVHYETSHIALMGDGVTPMYRISGTYVYGHVNPNENVIENVLSPRAPWMKDFVDRTWSTGNQSQGIIDLSGIGGLL